MVQRLKPPIVHTTTTEGELKIAIELTININTNGEIAVQAIQKAAETKEEVPKETPIEESPLLEIPDFTPAPKIRFGKGFQ